MEATEYPKTGEHLSIQAIGTGQNITLDFEVMFINDTICFCYKIE